MIKNLCLLIVLCPLFGALLAGLWGRQIGRVWAHRITISALAVAFFVSLYVAKLFLIDGAPVLNTVLYTWITGGSWFPFSFKLGFLIDPLTAVMLVVVTFVSLLVHIYSIGYMVEDSGYQRFFSYISLFTFAMLMLVTANNFLQLFFGWEGVGLVSYLLIGFWFHKESALQGSLKAFLVNRVGDLGFLLGIAVVLAYAGSLDYAHVFAQAPYLAGQTITIFSGHTYSLLTVICLLLFIGAMGKSAQIPLHVWLPESMEGPTPISALIHAATMVTAGVFMVARMSPLFEYSQTALSVVLVIGATGALFTGLLAIVMNDIKRVIAYSTLSQLGYMMAAMGVSAYSVGIFHLMTHACFKAALFLAAGSVIIAMHHEQDMRKMGGLMKKMPITYATFLLAGLALCAIPPFAGFYSKDLIIDAVHLATIPGAHYAYYCVAIGAFVTGLYTFRALLMTFHGKPRMSKEQWEHAKESPWTVCLPLILLAIPSVCAGYLLLQPLILAHPAWLSSSIVVHAGHDVMSRLTHDMTGPWMMMVEAPKSLSFCLALSGMASAALGYVVMPRLPKYIAAYSGGIYRLLERKYGFDDFNDWFFVRGVRHLGNFFSNIGDRLLIDGMVVNGSGKMVSCLAAGGRRLQTGYLYHYVAVMVVALLVFLAWWILL